MRFGGFVSNFSLINGIVFFYLYLCSLQDSFIPFYGSLALFLILNLEIVIFFLSRSLVFAKDRILEILFWIYQLLFLSITPLSIVWDGDPHFLNLDLKSLNSDFAIFLIFFCNLVVGVLTFKGQTNKEFNFNWIDSESLLKRTNILRSYYFILAPILVGFIGYSYIFRKIRYSVSVDFGPIFYIAEALLYVVPIVIFLSYSVIFKITHFKEVRKWKNVFGVLLVVLSNPVANARQIVLLLAVPLIYPKLRESTKVAIMFCYSLIIGALFLSNPFNRFTGTFEGFHFNPISRLGDYDSYSQLSFAIKLGQEGHFPPMNQILGSIFFFVPRQIWPAKPFDSGVVIGIARQLRSTNLSCPWIAEAYINGGLVFVLITTLLLAGFFIKLRNFNYSSTYILEGMISAVALILLRGSLLQASGKTIFGLITAFYIIRPKKKELRITSKLKI